MEAISRITPQSVPSEDSTKIAETIPSGKLKSGKFVISGGGKLSPKGGAGLNPATTIIANTITSARKLANGMIIFFFFIEVIPFLDGKYNRFRHKFLICPQVAFLPRDMKTHCNIRTYH